MRRFSFRTVLSFPLAFSLTLCAIALMSATPAVAAGKKLEVVQHEQVAGELLVKFRSKVTDTQAQDVLKKHGGGGHDAKRFKAPKKAAHAAIGRWWHVKLAKGRDAKRIMERLAKDPNVEAVEPNYVVRAILTPDDPLRDQLWGMNNTSQTGGAYDADIDAYEAWDHGTGSSNVLVAVIDTGIDYTHPDLAANMWTNPGEVPGNGIDDDGNGYVDDVYGYDFYNVDANPIDDNGHGTHCAGTIAAVGNNGIGVVGVSWNARLMAVKFLGGSGGGSITGAINSVIYATNMGARIMSNSWGGGGYSQALYDAIAAANDANALFVAAAGNSNSNNDVLPHYPSSYDVPNVLAVAATDHSDARAYFSSYGASSVDLGAPGVNILSTFPMTIDATGYRQLSGTSMATPHVSGAAALLLAQNGTRTAQGLKALLMGTTDPIPSMAGVTVSGGRLNINNAMSCSATQIQLSVSRPANNFTAYVNEPQALRASTTVCGTPVTGTQVSVNFTTGQVVTLYDDGAHDDGAANDGVYGNTWTPTTLGSLSLTVMAIHPSLGTDYKTLNGQVSERVGYQIAMVPFSWNDITDGTRHPLTDDSSITIPIGFSFNFYGTTYSDITIGSNGLLAFNMSGATSLNNVALPDTTTPNAVIAPFWDDLNPAMAGGVYSKLEGAAPNRQFTVAWVGVPHYSYGGAVSFEVTLREGADDIYVQYQDVVFGNAFADYGASATVGVENAEGTEATQYSYNSASLADATAARVFRASGVNNAPIANPGGPYQANVNQSLTFNGAGSYDPDGSPITYRWDFGDGAIGAGVQPSHTYNAVGTYTVTLIVNDGALDSATVMTTVTVASAVNQPPTADAGGPYQGYFNQPITFNGGASRDPEGNELTYRWTFGDGSSGTGMRPTHAYTGYNTFTVTLIVNDGEHDSAPATTTVTVFNRSPMANAGGPYQTYVNQPLTLDGSASSDPDGQPLTYQWNFGDGTSGTGVQPTHTYTSKGTYTVSLIVSDGFVTSYAAFATVTVPNRAPVALPGGPYSGDVGSAISFSSIGSSDPDGDTLTYAWTFGDGTTGSGPSPSHTYTAPGTYSVSLVVNDGTVSSAASSTSAQITNRPPLVSAGADLTVRKTVGSVSLNASASDPEGYPLGTIAWRQLSGPTVTITNGNTLQPTISIPKSTKPGQVTLELTVTDNFGASASDQVVINITQ